ncbi:hypothetical protein LUD75_02130 [Epilithonimonas sp. JDS]|uniref:hypothetical protein n=1 Tax=Epilithonimonas sp. JDS TaxID=2902797 RepID=UPI001E29956A|nr:hypothetical protein [Epilithonimonas sp. JDS]MCD9853487.1 hypothetical protein [Epilithonimonas sp. JDS]
MKTKTILSLLIMFCAFISCDRITDNYYEHQAQENYTSPYMGKWVGSYTGQGSGNITLSVSKSGNITGTYGQNNDALVSYVYDDGTLQPVLSENYTFFLYGKLKDKKGTWKNGTLSGDWTLTKQ